MNGDTLCYNGKNREECVRILGPNYAGKLVPLPKADGVLLEMDEKSDGSIDYGKTT